MSSFPEDDIYLKNQNKKSRKTMNKKDIKKRIKK